ncbi:PglZ domain-containing protein [Limibacterium fermenti]|uniref:T9SS response regulator signal transducer PorX n=1 Tax=Limibacterium fermenti TaxID=3229863 RepID=UPI000E8100A9|nr:two-component system response regulator [Porphyromonadaceae bacterium]
MKKAHFLWVDDEIDLLKPYILFLEEKGYSVDCANNGNDALEMCRLSPYDLIFMDEHMPGLTGLETLSALHTFRPDIPVVMITKSEDEGIMNKAIGKKIADYLIKPVKPNQILITIKKLLDQKEIISETATVDYRGEFNKLSEDIGRADSATEWTAIYKKIVFWEMEFARSQHPMQEFVMRQKEEAGKAFGKFIKRHYEAWINGNDPSRPLMSPQLLEQQVFPLIDRGEKVFLILIDNFRLDQWLAIKDVATEHFLYTEQEYFSILPTATQYARNSLFAGMLPNRIAADMPQYWVEESEETGKNLHEADLLAALLSRLGRKGSFSYTKINLHQEGERFANGFSGRELCDLTVGVFNFIDMLSHARTESKMLRELASDEAAYRSLTRSWFLHSSLPSLLSKIAGKGGTVVLTTDHGTIRVKHPQKVTADKQTNANLRYKAGKNLAYDPKKVFSVTHPESIGLPSPNVSTRYIFALDNDFFAYPNNFNHFASYYENTFQHGGISMEEMIVPLITLHPKQ